MELALFSTMRIHLSTLVVFLVALSAMGCTSSARSVEEIQEARAFLSQTAYAPDGPREIIGCYFARYAMDGELLDLRPDGTYFYRNWSDFVVPLAGYVGTYHVIRDVVVLNVESSVILTETERRIEKHPDAKRATVFRFKQIDGLLYVMHDRLEMVFARASLENGGYPPTEVIAGVEYSSLAMRREADEFCEHWRD